MELVITFGMIAVFFAGVIAVLVLATVKDETFTDYAIAGRSFGGFYQAMSFLNTWWPGTVFISFAGLAAGSGVLGFYALSYTSLIIVVMYLIARPVFIWGARFDLRTQPDYFALRYNSRHIRTVSAVIGIVSSFPFIVLGMQSLGLLFSYLSLERLSFTQALILGIALLAARQYWTIRQGMRGVVLTDMYQGIVAYLVGTALIFALLVYVISGTSSPFGAVEREMYALPGPGSELGPLYVFAIIFTGALGGWCYPVIFVRLLTANSVRSLKHSAFVSAPLSLVFAGSLLFVSVLASRIPEVAEAPEEVWFILSQQAGGGVWLLALAGVVVFAATMGNVDGNIQANGAQFANDLVGNYTDLSDRSAIIIAKVGMVVLVGSASVIAALNLPALYTLAVLAYQGIIQLGVPQFLGIFWKRGNKIGAMAGMIVGFVVAVVLEFFFPNSLPWAWGLTSGLVGLAVNLAIYVAAAYLLPHGEEERRRLDELFGMVRRAETGREELQPAGQRVGTEDEPVDT